MSMFDKSTLCKTRCPDCGGKIYRDYFGGDCRGNPPLTTIWCKKCKKEFTEEEWSEIEKTANMNPGIKLAIKMANADLKKSGLKRILEEAGKTAKEKPKKKATSKKTGRKTESKGYDVCTNANGTKCVWYRLLGEGDGSVSADVIDRIIKAEFPRVPRKKIIFSIDNEILYFGNDL